MQQLVLLASLALDALRNPFSFALLVTGTTLLVAFFKRQYAVAFFLTVSLTFVLTHVLKALFKVPRPESTLVEIGGYRFPSLHAALAGAFFISIWWYIFFSTESNILRGLITLGAISAMGFVAWSRVFLGVHMYSDVLVGLFIGIVVSVFTHIFILRF